MGGGFVGGWEGEPCAGRRGRTDGESEGRDEGGDGAPGNAEAQGVRNRVDDDADGDVPDRLLKTPLQNSACSATKHPD